VGAVPRSEPHFRYQRYAAKCSALYRARTGTPLRAEQPTFNAGVLLVDLERWRAQNLTAEAAWWMRQHALAPEGLWALGSQVSPLHLPCISPTSPSMLALALALTLTLTLILTLTLTLTLTLLAAAAAPRAARPLVRATTPELEP